MTGPDSCGRKPKGSVRGKSEHHRAGCRVTPGGGDSKESATENYRHDLVVRMKRRGKSSPVSGRSDSRVNPTRCNSDRELSWPDNLDERLEVCRNVHRR